MSPGWQPMLEQLVRERYGALVARATIVTGTRADALDLVHDALVATFGAGARFATVAHAEQYVCRAITTRFVDRERRRGRERGAVVRLAGMTTGVVEDPAPDVLGADVVAALAELAPRERACVLLRHLDDLSVHETAQLLGLSEGAVKRYTADGIAHLNARFGTTVETSDVVPVSPLPREENRHGR